MDEYDLRRIPSFKVGYLKLSADELKSFLALEPRLSEDEIRNLARPDVAVDRLLREREKL